jgi:1-acyl-sn-glycerol-3-phosphate acyltransferase
MAGSFEASGLFFGPVRLSSPDTVIAVLRSIATYVVVALYIALLGPLALGYALIAGNPRLLYRVARVGVGVGLLLSGIRTRVEGAERIQRNRAAVYAVNHTSNVEPPILYDALSDLFPRLRILYKAELRKLPVLVRAFDLAGFVPLERGNPEQSLPAIERAAAALREGNSFLIFPEGTRSRAGNLLPFKKGGFIMAIKAQAPVVPVAIVGARNALRKGSFVINPVIVTVRIGTPIETQGLTLDDRDKLIDVARARVEELLRAPAAAAGREGGPAARAGRGGGGGPREH